MVGDYDAPHDAPREKPLSPSNVEVRLTSCVVPHSPFQALPGFRSDLVPAEDGPAAACCKVLQLATDRALVRSFLPSYLRQTPLPLAPFLVAAVAAAPPAGALLVLAAPSRIGLTE